jgi:hypothetical protein
MPAVIQRLWRVELADIEPPPLSWMTEGEDGAEKDFPDTVSPDHDRSAGSVDPFRSEDFAQGREQILRMAEDAPVEMVFSAGTPNHNEAFWLEMRYERRVSRTLSVIVSKIAEDLGGWPVDGDDEWSMEALMARRLNRAPLSSCRQSREKESLVLILDNSGSCLPQARFYNQVAAGAVQAGDVELYAAPNAGIAAKRGRNGWLPVDEKAWPFHRRTIVFFGDYDGGDQVVEASWHNRVYWFCSEGDRYPQMSLHPWCSYSLDRFRGRYFECNQTDDFIHLLKKVR